jgi:uncharacterized membrane protein
MVIANIDDISQTGQITLRPNYSWSWRFNLYVLYTLVSISLTIGAAFLAIGAWMVLPYSILGLLFLLACIYYCLYQSSKQEVITVSRHDVRIEKGRKKPEESWAYKRLWARFMVHRPRHSLDPAVVSIRSHGHELELGSFLNMQDKLELIEQLRRVVPH